MHVYRRPEGEGESKIECDTPNSIKKFFRQDSASEMSVVIWKRFHIKCIANRVEKKGKPPNERKVLTSEKLEVVSNC